MKNQFTDLPADVQSKLRSTKSLCLDLLLPKTEVLAICVSIGHGYRDRIYNLMIVVWMFITQILLKDHNCQQAVTRLNAWRVGPRIGESQ